MGSLKQKSKEELLKELHELVSQERNLGLKVLAYLKEIKSRRLHQELGYSSLFVFCVEELKYTEAMAHHRINALDLMEEIPEVKPSLEKGELSVATLSMVQGAIKREKKENNRVVKIEEKSQILKEIKNHSKKEAEKVIFKYFPNQEIKPERERRVTEQVVEIRFNADEELIKKLNRIKDLTAHKHASPSYNELFNEMADFMLKKIDHTKTKEAIIKTEETKNTESQTKESENTKHDQNNQCQKVLATVKAKESQLPQTRYIQKHIREEVWKRADGRCEFINHTTKHRCTETRRLQVDHIKPYALGGENYIENLRLLCAGHNIFSAITYFGDKKINKHINGYNGTKTE